MIHSTTRQVLATETPDEDRIPRMNEPVFDTDTPRKDVVYQIKAPDGSVVRKYVQVTEVYGKQGVARCRVLQSYDAKANIIAGDIGQEMVVDLKCLTQPDVFPGLAMDIPKWVECSAMSLTEIKAYAKQVISGYMKTQVIAFDITNDLDRTIKGIKNLLRGKIGGFFLTLLLGFLKSHIAKSIVKKTGAVDQKQAFQRKLTDSRYLFSKPGPGALNNDERRDAKIKLLTKQLERDRKAESTKPVVKKHAVDAQKPGAKKPSEKMVTPGLRKA